MMKYESKNTGCNSEGASYNVIILITRVLMCLYNSTSYIQCGHIAISYHRHSTNSR